MARVKLKIDPNTPKKILDIILKEASDPKLEKKITETLSNQVRKLQTDFNDNKIPPLKKKTIDKRIYLSKYNSTHPNYSARRSNLTFTGKLIDSFKTKIERSGKVEIAATGLHPGYKTAGGRTSPVENDVIVGAQKDLGRDLTTLGDITLLKLSKLIINFVKNKIER